MKQTPDMNIAHRKLSLGPSLPEGPVAMEDGSVLVVEIQGKALVRVQPDGDKSIVAELSGGPNGAAIGPDGRCYICNNGGFQFHQVGSLSLPGIAPLDYSGGYIEAVDLKSGRSEVIYGTAATFSSAGRTTWFSISTAVSGSPIPAR
jgi:gluconolactonase